MHFACTASVDTAGCSFSRRSGGLLPFGAHPLQDGRSSCNIALPLNMSSVCPLVTISKAAVIALNLPISRDVRSHLGTPLSLCVVKCFGPGSDSAESD